MNAKAAYEFLKPVLDQMPEDEQKMLSEMIYTRNAKAGLKKKKVDSGRSVEWYKKQLLKTVFKSRNYH